MSDSPFGFSSSELTLSIEDFKRRYIDPAIADLANVIRIELRRRRMSRRVFFNLSGDRQAEIVRDALMRHAHRHQYTVGDLKA